MLTPEQIRQAEDAAEEIVAAVQVGFFHGTMGEYANALLVLRARDNRLQAEEAAHTHEQCERAEQDAIEEARAKGDY